MAGSARTETYTNMDRASSVRYTGPVLGLLLLVASGNCWPWGSDPFCPSGPEPVCPSNPADDTSNYFSHPTDCHYYIQCDGSRKPICRPCGPTIYFSPKLLNCLWPLDAKCEHNATTRQDSLLPPICGPDRIPHLDCDREGSTFRDPSSCDHYYKCTGGTKVRNKCQSGQHYNGLFGACDDPCKAGCNPGVNCDYKTTAFRTVSTTSKTTSVNCIPGVNCPTKSTTTKSCIHGVNCPTKSTTTASCITGVNCPTKSATTSSCIPGVNCPTRSTTTKSCIPGVNCPTRSTTTKSCIPGVNCPTKSTTTASCITGVNCPTKSTTTSSCIPGVNCPTKSTTTPSCIPGVNCPTRSTPTPSCVPGVNCPTRSTPTTRCISGINCSEAKTTKCTPGYNCQTTSKCVSGYNCEDEKIPMCFSSRDCDNPRPECPVCNEDGETFAHPLNCDWFYKCQGKVAVPVKCGCGFLYNARYKVCDYPCNVDCKGRTKRATQLKMFCQVNASHSSDTMAFSHNSLRSKCG